MSDETEAGTTTTAEGGFTLSGYNSPKELADALSAHWTEAVASLFDGSVARYARETFNDPKLADDIAEIAKDKSVAEDTRLFRVVLRLDPRTDAQFMGYEVSEAGLGELAAEVDGPFPTWSATAALRIMYTDRVLTLYAEAAKSPRFGELDERWRAELETWGGLVGRSREAGGMDVYADTAWRTRAKILRGLLDTKDDEALRSGARDARKNPTVAEWTRDADPVDGAGIGTLLASVDLEPAALAYEENQRAERQAASSARRRGVVSTIVLVLVLGGVVVGLIAFTKNNANLNAFDTTSPTPTATAATSIDPATATVLGTEIVQNPTPLLKDPKDGSETVQQLPKGERLFRISNDTDGFYLVKTAKDEKVIGWVARGDVAEICPVQCG